VAPLSAISRRRGPGLLFAAVVPALTLLAAAPASDSAGEYEVKAAFLYNFTRFVEWPPEAFPDANAPLTLCVVGKDPFGEVLDDVVRDETVGGRRLAVVRPGPGDDLAHCQLLFVSRSEHPRLGALLRRLQGKSVFTVGEEEGFLEAGGILRFVRAGRSVRFEINQAAAERAPLKISSKLMRLGVAAGGEGGP
jgi:uncharacterized protein DUF4154